MRTKLLIVEDDVVVGNIYRNKFCLAGYDVEVARDGEEALRLMHENPPQAMLLDLMIPKINGVEVLKRIRADATLKQTPVVVVTNGYLTNLVEAAWKAGATMCVTKMDAPPKQLVEI